MSQPMYSLCPKLILYGFSLPKPDFCVGICLLLFFSNLIFPRTQKVLDLSLINHVTEFLVPVKMLFKYNKKSHILSVQFDEF